MSRGIYGVSSQSAYHRSADMVIAASNPQSSRANTLVAWLVLIGLIIPAAEVQVYIAGAKFTVARLAIIPLVLPALFMLFGRTRRFVLSDLFVWATAMWIVAAAVYVNGSEALSSAGAQAIEIIGGYMVARAYFFGPNGLQGFLSVLKVFTLAAIVLAMADFASGRLVTHGLFSSLLGVPAIVNQARMGTIRAASTFDHAILFGAFCAVVAAMLLYSETNVVRRILWVGFCFFGVMLSLSSSSLMGFAIMLGTYSYGALTKQFPWRWWVCWIVLAIFVLAVMGVINNPLGWILSHLTLEPESGYFRLLEWNSAFFQISQSPWTGYAFFDFGTVELHSIDCVWLALSLRYGLPVIVFLFLANVTSVLPVKNSRNRTGDPHMTKMSTAFSLILVMFMFIGLTVHYWNYMWIFWGVCIGIRASLREYSMGAAAQPVRYSRSMPNESANGRYRSPAQA